MDARARTGRGTHGRTAQTGHIVTARIGDLAHLRSRCQTASSPADDSRGPPRARWSVGACLLRRRRRYARDVGPARTTLARTVDSARASSGPGTARWAGATFHFRNNQGPGAGRHATQASYAGTDADLRAIGCYHAGGQSSGRIGRRSSHHARCAETQTERSTDRDLGPSPLTKVPYKFTRSHRCQAVEVVK